MVNIPRHLVVGVAVVSLVGVLTLTLLATTGGGSTTLWFHHVINVGGQHDRYINGFGHDEEKREAK